jgi:hypothetical protein
MRKKVEYDKKAMSSYGYKQVPLKQILNLDLSSEEMIILLNFFSNADGWTMGSKGITERSFYREKNKKRVGIIMRKLKDMGYINETENSFIISILKIQKDYLKNTTGVTLDNPKEGAENTLVGVTENTPVRVITDNPQEVIESNLNKINNKEKGETIRINQTAVLGSFSSDLDEIPTKFDITPKNVKNDLPLVLEKNSHFKSMYNSTPWHTLDISNFSNVYIAYAVKEKLDNNPMKEIEKRTYYFLAKLVEYSKKVPESELYTLFCNECIGREDLILKLDNQ